MEKKYPIYDKDDPNEVKQAKRRAYVDREKKEAEEKIKKLKAKKRKTTTEMTPEYYKGYPDRKPASHDSSVPRKIKKKNGG